MSELKRKHSDGHSEEEDRRSSKRNKMMADLRHLSFLQPVRDYRRGKDGRRGAICVHEKHHTEAIMLSLMATHLNHTSTTTTTNNANQVDANHQRPDTNNAEIVHLNTQRIAGNVQSSKGSNGIRRMSQYPTYRRHPHDTTYTTTLDDRRRAEQSSYCQPRVRRRAPPPSSP